MQHIIERGWAGLALAGCIVAALARPADACSCGKPEDDETAFRNADVVFVATIADQPPRPTKPPYEYVFELAVEGVWKGSVPRTVKLRTGQGGGDCGREELVKSDRWIFFLKTRGPSAELTTEICDNSQPATNKLADALTRKHGKPKPPK